jgi:hypothetical protein
LPEPIISPTIYLSDGGVWNNLGTQALMEDTIFQGNSRGIGAPSIVIVANASGGLRPQSGIEYLIPGWSEIKSLLRIVHIQNVNTVVPRVVNLVHAREQAWRDDNAPSSYSPLAIEIDIRRSPERLLWDWHVSFTPTRQRTLFSRSEYRWALNTLRDIEKIVEQDDVGHAKLRCHIVKSLRNKPRYRSNLEYRSVEDLETWSGFRQLCSLAQGKLEEVPTTLGRLSRKTAMALIARGYVNTLAAAHVFQLCNVYNMLSRLSRERLESLTS